MSGRDLLAKLGFALLVLSFSANAAVTLLDKDDWKFVFAGFAEFDIISDSTRSFTEVVGSNPVARPGGLSGDNGRTLFSTRNSRFDFALLPPVYAGWKSKGYMEFDLLGATNGTTEASMFTNPTVRMRHMYLTAESEGFKVLTGQYWTLFGWQMYYLSPNVSDPPMTGALYERTPQVTVMKTFGSLEAALSVVRPIQRDAQWPGLDGGLRFSYDGRKGAFSNGQTVDEKQEPLSVAVTGTVRDVAVPQAGSSSSKSHQLGYAVAVDAMIPIIASPDGKDVSNNLILVGEYTTGQGYGDEFPGWTANYKQLTAATDGTFGPTGINLDPGQGGFDGAGAFQLMKLQTFNAYLEYHFPSEWRTFVNAGYAQLYSSNATSLTGTPAAGTVYYRDDIVFANLYHDFTNNIRAAVEYDYIRTKYADGVEPHNHRFQFSTWFRF